MIAPRSTTAPSKMTELWPMKACDSILQEYKVHPDWITFCPSMIRFAVNPVEVSAAVCKTQLLPIEILL
jgi:hypothetical protein